MNDQVFWLLFGGIATLVGLGFTFVGTKLVISSWRRQAQDRSWPRTTAEVVSAAQERREGPGRGTDSEVRYVLVVRYRYRHPTTGAMLEGTADAPRDRAIATDQPVEIVYDPEDPTRSHLPGAVGLRGAAGVGCATVVGGFFAVVGLGILAVTAWVALA